MNPERVLLRQDLIFQGLHDGLSSDQIDRILRHEAKRYGNANEKKFKVLTTSCLDWVVESVEKPTRREDMDRGIDFWLNFKYHENYPWLKGTKLPVQVKSSETGVKEFRNDQKYLSLGKKVVVIYACEGISKTNFKKQFISELSRIHNLALTNN
jgi:hypothetical protein